MSGGVGMMNASFLVTGRRGRQLESPALEPTVVREHGTTILVVGPSGRNADRVTAALEQAKMRVVRVGSAPVASQKLAGVMPQVVVLVSTPSTAQRDELADHS